MILINCGAQADLIERLKLQPGDGTRIIVADSHRCAAICHSHAQHAFQQESCGRDMHQAARQSSVAVELITECCMWEHCQEGKAADL